MGDGIVEHHNQLFEDIFVFEPLQMFRIDLLG